jgi:hypothetical protein
MDGGPPTYFSCADIRIGNFPDAAPSADAGNPDDDSGVSTGPTDVDGSDPGSSSSGSAPRRLTGGDDGCSVGWNVSAGAGLFMGLGIGALFIARRRRKP